MKASDLLVECLEGEGVEYVFGVPGEENLDLLDSLSRSSIRLVLTRHEQAAGFMAAADAQLAGIRFWRLLIASAPELRHPVEPSGRLTT